MSYKTGQVIIERDGTEVQVQTWSIQEILQKVTESADFTAYDAAEYNMVEFTGSATTWAYIIASKAGDDQTPILAQKILDEGFLHPICIYRTERGGYGIGNGHHRLICAILLGLDEIPVFYCEDGNYYPECSSGSGEIWESDDETANMLYEIWTATYQELDKEEQIAENEEW